MAVLKEVLEKFWKATDKKKKTSSALPTWGDIYRLRVLPEFHKAPKLDESFSPLLGQTLSSSQSIALSLDEACLCGMIESQSFALWAFATIFEFLLKVNCVPDDPLFAHLVASMTMAINAQVKASFLVAAFLKHKCRETYVSHLPVSTHSLVKHTLLSTLSFTELFDKEVTS